ncbi:MAG: hypothetical protein FWG98_00520 [Candidatus Cloacimonetes bacterium]|nr:hypothetical protein [Candidatus Cloacimonadota bacterium]
MPEMQIVDVSVHGVNLRLLSEEPEEVIALAKELEMNIISLVNQYPRIKDINLLTLACLKALEDNKRLKLEIKELVAEREKLNNTVQGFLYSID